MIAALASVQGVGNKQITELQQYKKPPERVRIALEPVIALLMDSNKTPEWKTIQEQLRKPDFKNNVLGFNKDNISPACKNFI